jgi:CYTH domain-containing protein
MAKEIERKFLVRDDRWKSDAGQGSRIRQAYILAMDGRNMRVRVRDNRKATLTIKAGGHGLTRDEFEFDVPVDEALPLFQLKLGNLIEKTRYKIKYARHVWEVDVYSGALAGLVVAEVEMKSEKERPEIPDWIGPELTGNPAYSNQALALSGLPADAYAET